jgi:glycosyltransferase involved in cell wall biosynthesis
VTDTVSDLVSTIIPVYNRPQMLREAVASVLAQTYRPIEIIVVDDGSTDETPSVAEGLAAEHPEEIRFVRKENSGPGPTREAGRQVARGEFIQYLDSDDLLRPQKFELMVRALRERPECGAAYGYICVHHGAAGPDPRPARATGERRETLFPWILVDRWWNTDCPLFRREVCDRIGPWSDLRWSQDWEYDGRVAALGTRLVHCPEFVCDERRHSGLRQTGADAWMDPARLHNHHRFLQRMLEYAEAAGIAPDCPQRMHFTRWVFLTARQLAAVGLGDEARQCLMLMERSAGGHTPSLRGLAGFWRAARILGLQRAGRWSMVWDRLRRGRSGMTLALSMCYERTAAPDSTTERDRFRR